jgi:hypothetical protein
LEFFPFSQKKKLYKITRAAEKFRKMIFSKLTLLSTQGYPRKKLEKSRTQKKAMPIFLSKLVPLAVDGVIHLKLFRGEVLGKCWGSDSASGCRRQRATLSRPR